MSGDSKLKETELWQGFYFKVSEPIHAQWQGKPLTLLPYPEGIPVFMPQPETLSLPEDVTVVMIENSENFLKIETQLPLFQGLKCFFVSFYPREQHSYFIEWLQKQPNNYVHYGDFDFAGIHIYQSQYKNTSAANRVTLFLPVCYLYSVDTVNVNYIITSFLCKLSSRQTNRESANCLKS